MDKVKSLSRIGMGLFLIFVLMAGCNAREEKTGVTVSEQKKVAEKPPSSEDPFVAPSKAPAMPEDVIIEVDGSKFTRSRLDTELNKRLASAKQQIPTGRLQEAKASIRGKLVNDFVARTLLVNEVKRLQIKASEQEITEALEQLKNSLPPGVTMEDLIKRNETTAATMHDEIGLKIKIDKLVMAQLAGKNKPTEKDIYRFYEDHKDKFKTGESVHVRHILIAAGKKDDDKVRAEKKGRVELLRKQLLEGADFAELAAKNSDCPSKQGGGDLGLLYRGQSVKSFEDAAFSQQVKVIGPVVETEYGYHIIQVLEHNPPQQVALDKKIRQDIASFIAQQNQEEAFANLMNKLKAKATIIVHDNK
jgi:peptidyl-prolyl cis-trans isomerase C